MMAPTLADHEWADRGLVAGAQEGQEQNVFGIVIWACSLLGVSCATATDPTVSTIQAAYELESQSSGSRHDTGLKVVEAKCHDKASASAESNFLCEVQFISTADPAERLYFDIVAVTRNGDDWKLVSGLCKR